MLGFLEFIYEGNILDLPAAGGNFLGIFRIKYSKIMYYSARRRRTFFGVIFCIIDRQAKKVVFIPPFVSKSGGGRGDKYLDIS